LLEVYASALRPAAAYALDLRSAPRWALGSVLASCVAVQKDPPPAALP